MRLLRDLAGLTGLRRMVADEDAGTAAQSGPDLRGRQQAGHDSAKCPAGVGDDQMVAVLADRLDHERVVVGRGGDRHVRSL